MEKKKKKKKIKKTTGLPIIKRGFILCRNIYKKTHMEIIKHVFVFPKWN